MRYQGLSRSQDELRCIIEDLSLSLVYGYLNARYVNYIGYNFATGQIENFSGNQMVRAPEHTATVAAEYLWPLEGNGRIIPRIQYFVSDEIFFNASTSPRRFASSSTSRALSAWLCASLSPSCAAMSAS